MWAFPAALGVALIVGLSASWVAPYRSDIPAWWTRESIRIVYACPEGYVCFPKDQSKHVNTGLLPSRLVQTTAYRASDYPPAVQAQETRKRKPSRR